MAGQPSTLLQEQDLLPDRPSWGRYVVRPLEKSAGVLSVVIAMLLWEAAGRAGMINPLIASYPSEMFATARQVFASGEIYPHMAVTGTQIGWGMLISTAVGVPLGLLMGRYTTVGAVLEPYVVGLYTAPTVALFPILLVWFGLGMTSKVALIFLSAVVVMAVNSMAGVRAVPTARYDLARIFLSGEVRTFFSVILPTALPYIMVGFRLALGRAIIMAFVAEFYGANEGIGYLVTDAGNRLDMPLLFVGVGIFVVFGVTVARLVRVVEEGPLRRFGV